MSDPNPTRRFYDSLFKKPPPGHASPWRRRAIIIAVGLLGLLMGAGIGAAGKDESRTVTVVGGITTVKMPARTVVRTVVHVHVHTATQTITTTVSAPAAETPGPSGAEEDEVGSTSHATDLQFCEEHTCIGAFDTEEGTIVECADGTYSHAGGISGACSDHGGEK